MTKLRKPDSRSRGESGATLIIVVLMMGVFFGIAVLAVDVGGLLLRRRAVVNAADAAALAAAQTCAVPVIRDPSDPEYRADEYAMANEPALTADSGGILYGTGETKGCRTGPGHVTVKYTAKQPLFFAQVLGFGDEASVVGKATAYWGECCAVPLALDGINLYPSNGCASLQQWADFQSTCGFLVGSQDSKGNHFSALNFAIWPADPNDPNQCNGGGGNSDDTGLRSWVLNGPPGPLPVPNYVCPMNPSGIGSLLDAVAQIKGPVNFPVNDANKQIFTEGKVRDYYIYTFVEGEIVGVVDSSNQGTLNWTDYPQCGPYISNAACVVIKFRGWGERSSTNPYLALCDLTLATCKF